MESLIEFKKGIAKFGLPEDELSIVNGKVTEAIVEAKKEQPDPSEIKSRFKGAIETIANVGDTVEKVSKWKWTGKVLKILGLAISFVI